MTKAEALSRIEMIDGMTGSRAIALVDALDALGLLRLVPQLEQTIADHPAGNFREVKDSIAAKHLAGVDTYDAIAPFRPVDG